MTCIFCKIIKKEQPADIIYEDDEMIVFKDINPKAIVHLLIVPKKHLKSVNHLDKKEELLAGKIILTAQKIAKDLGIAQKGYKLVFNVGKGAGQIIDHIHLHLLAGDKIEMP